MNPKPEIALPNPKSTAFDASGPNPLAMPKSDQVRLAGERPASADQHSEPVTPPSKARGNGKVARLPKALRDQVNTMLDDGFTYKAIIQKLNQSTDPPLPYRLLEMNISRWKDNGYQAYLRHRDCRADFRSIREAAADVTELNDGPQFQEAVIQLGLIEIFRTLKHGQTKGDPLNHIRLFNALARLNHEAIGLRQLNGHHNQEVAAP